MRLLDFLQPYLEGVSRVSERHSGALSLEPYLGLPDGVGYERSRERPVRDADPVATEPADARDVLMLGLLGPDPERYGREDDALALIAGLRPDQRCTIAFGYPAPGLPVHRLLDALARSHSQLVQLSSLEHQHLFAAAMIVQVGDDLVVPRDPFGQRLDSGSSPALAPAARRRLASEFVLLDFVARNLRAQVFRLGGNSAEGADAVRRRDELERWTEQAKSQAEEARTDADTARAELRRAQAEATAAQKEADALRREVATLAAEIDRITGSTSFRLGRVLVETARHPATTPHLPVDLVRLWRRRGAAPGGTTSRTRTMSASGAGGGSGTGDVVRPAELPDLTASRTAADDQRRRYLAHSAFEMRPRLRPVVAGILTDATALALHDDAVVNRIGPNDARLVIERSEPDVLLVETAALGPGHGWAYAGDPAATDRTSVLLEAIEHAHALGRAAVLVRDRRLPASVGLIPLESSFDLVVDADRTDGAEQGWSRGVPLHRFHPIGARDQRDPRPLQVGGVPCRASIRVRRFADQVAAALGELDVDVRLDAEDTEDEEIAAPGMSRGVPPSRLPWADAPALYRTRLAGLAGPITVDEHEARIEPRVLEQLACGMAIVSGPNAALGRELAQHVRIATDPAGVVETLREALGRGPRPPTETRALLRTLFERHATPVMLATITRRLGSVPDPLASRTVSVVIGGADPAAASRLVDSVLRQAHRPAEVLFAGEGDWPAGGRDALEAAGIPTRIVKGRGSVPLTWAEVGATATSAWLTRWPTHRSVAATWLLDLVVGGELSRAPVVAYGDDPPGYRAGVALDAAIVSRAAATTVLAEREVLAADRPPLVIDPTSGSPALSLGPEEGAA